MVYNNNLIAVIKHKGRILREFKGNTVRLPFGSDYSIYIKNKDTIRKVVIQVKVDGKDVLDGNSLLVDPRSTVELKGFMKGSVVKNKFRFIEKTDEISKHRGNFVEDGLIELEYQFEEYLPTVTWTYAPDYYGYYYSSTPVFSNRWEGSSCLTSNNTKALSSFNNDSGITVPGAETHQSFNRGNVGNLESVKYNIIINLKGEEITNNKKKIIKKPITVRTKLQCPTCGRHWSSNLKYCGNCSTYLQ